MNWSPYIEFRCGHDQENWDRLTPEQQKDAYRATGKQRRTEANPLIVHYDEDKEISWLPAQFPIRTVHQSELDVMPVFQMYL
jgi:hypothetical protein